MEAFKNETREIIRRFKAHDIPFEECVRALADVLAKVSPMGGGWQMDSVRDLVLANNEIVMKEMERRTPAQPVARKIGWRLGICQPPSKIPSKSC